jgi:hypothetical protein
MLYNRLTIPLTHLKASMTLLKALILTAALVSAPSFAAPHHASGRIIVEFVQGASPVDMDAALQPHHGKRHKMGQSSLHTVDVQVGSEAATVAKLSKNKAVKFAELDYAVATGAVVNDPYYGSEWHLPKINAPQAWDYSTGQAVTIAILDSGVDSSHPDLVGNLVAGYNLYDGNTNTADVCGHGTAVAGSAAGAMNNGIGVAGVAGNAKIMPIRIAYNTGSGCSAYISTIAQGITYAADHGARIANVSYGPLAGNSTIISAAQYMKDKGGLVFISAGNTGADLNAAQSTAYIVVSATDSNDAIPSWSSYGIAVSIAAPGAGIYTTNNGGGYGGWNGTSFSSPVAAGVAALMMSANPALSGTQIEAMMFSTAVDLGVAGRDAYYGYGRVDAYAGVMAAKNAAVQVDTQPPTISITQPTASSSVSGVITVSAVAADNVGVTRVDLYVDGTLVASETAAPYNFSWDTANVTKGMATIQVIAYDAAGNNKAANVVVSVYNAPPPIVTDKTPPSVTISNPISGAVSGVVKVNVFATDDSGAAGITNKLYINGSLAATGTGGALTYNWNTRKLAAGSYTISVKSSDKAGNVGTTSVVVQVGTPAASKK